MEEEDDYASELSVAPVITPRAGDAGRRLQTAATALKSEDTFGSALCRTGHTGPFCEVCLPNWYKGSDKLCNDCAAANGNLGVNIAIALTLVVAVLLVVIIMLCRGRNKAIAELMAGNMTEDGIEAKAEEMAARGDGKRRFGAVMAYRLVGMRIRSKIIMSLIQVMSAIGGVFEIAFPPIFSGMMNWLGMLQLDLPTALPLACIGAADYHTSLLLSTLVPLGVMLLLALIGVCLMRKADLQTSKGASRMWLGNVLLNLVFIILFFLYPSTSKKIFAAFQCKDIGDGTRWLRSDLSINCTSPEHVAMQAYAVVMLFVYPFGAPLLYAFLMFWVYGKQLHRLQAIEYQRTAMAQEAAAKDEYVRWDKATGKPTELQPNEATAVAPQLEALEVEEKVLRERLPGYIQSLSGNGYSLRVFYFEIVESLRKLTIVCVPVFFEPGSVTQLLFGLMICFLTFGAYTMLHPYAADEDNFVAILAQIIIFFSLVSSVALATVSTSSTVAQGLDIGLTFIFCTPILAEVWIDSGCSFASIKEKLSLLCSKKSGSGTKISGSATATI